MTMQVLRLTGYKEARIKYRSVIDILKVTRRGRSMIIFTCTITMDTMDTGVTRMLICRGISQMGSITTRMMDCRGTHMMQSVTKCSRVSSWQYRGVNMMEGSVGMMSQHRRMMN
jgi:hypothetical protein